VPPGNRITFPGRILLEEAIHRYDAPALAIRVPEHPLFRDGLRPGVDRLQIRTRIGIMRNQPPPKMPFDGEAGLGMAAEYKLQAGRTSPFIAELGHGRHSLKVTWPPIYHFAAAFLLLNPRFVSCVMAKRTHTSFIAQTIESAVLSQIPRIMSRRFRQQCLILG
jgi:hypothetical protein